MGGHGVTVWELTIGKVFTNEWFSIHFTNEIKQRWLRGKKEQESCHKEWGREPWEIMWHTHHYTRSSKQCFTKLLSWTSKKLKLSFNFKTTILKFLSNPLPLSFTLRNFKKCLKLCYSELPHCVMYLEVCKNSPLKWEFYTARLSTLTEKAMGISQHLLATHEQVRISLILQITRKYKVFITLNLTSF